MASSQHFVRALELATRPRKSAYGYTPTEWVCILYVVLFSITTAFHLGQTFYIKPRSYWILPTIVLCGLCELIGWAARLWSSINVFARNAFLMQITTTIIAPTFLTAALYTILGRLITRLGARFSRLTPKIYLIIFISADVAALVVQAVGGAKAASASNNNRPATTGAHIMLGGIFLQLVGVVLYSLLATEFLLRFHFQKPFKSKARVQTDTSSSDNEKEIENVFEGRGIMSRQESLMIAGLILATIFVIMRSVYRAIELNGGWTGRIFTTEKYFNILDGAPIVLAMFTLNLFHPGVLLRG
ncbi:RTA1 like protein [Gautieria morchelliformis]|nr:RTA1 like protein [Gautieria morchelliformis]